jgi:hypothetical protein
LNLVDACVCFRRRLRRVFPSRTQGVWTFHPPLDYLMISAGRRDPFLGRLSFSGVLPIAEIGRGDQVTRAICTANVISSLLLFCLAGMAHGSGAWPRGQSKGICQDADDGCSNETGGDATKPGGIPRRRRIHAPYQVRGARWGRRIMRLGRRMRCGGRCGFCLGWHSSISSVAGEKAGRYGNGGGSN